MYHTEAVGTLNRKNTGSWQRDWIVLLLSKYNLSALGIMNVECLYVCVPVCVSIVSQSGEFVCFSEHILIELFLGMTVFFNAHFIFVFHLLFLLLPAVFFTNLNKVRGFAPLC